MSTPPPHAPTDLTPDEWALLRRLRATRGGLLARAALSRAELRTAGRLAHDRLTIGTRYHILLTTTGRTLADTTPPAAPGQDL